MRALFLTVLSAIALCVGGCGPEPLKKTSLHYSPPAFYPVREKVTTAQKHAVAERSAADAAVKAIAKATSVAPANVPDLQEALAEASGQINQVVTENGSLQTALAATQKYIDELEPKVVAQTEKLNTCNDDKNSAIDAVHLLTTEKAIIEKRYHRLKLGAATLLTAVVSYLAYRLGVVGLLRKLALLGPYGFGGAIAIAVAFPGIIFAIVWRVL